MTEEELLQALRKAQQADPTDRPREGFYRVQEMCDIAGISRNALYKILRKLKSAQRLEMRKVPYESLSGVIRPTPAYRILTDEPTPADS